MFEKNCQVCLTLDTSRISTVLCDEKHSKIHIEGVKIWQHGKKSDFSFPQNYYSFIIILPELVCNEIFYRKIIFKIVPVVVAKL